MLEFKEVSVEVVYFLYYDLLIYPPNPQMDRNTMIVLLAGVLGAIIIVMTVIFVVLPSQSTPNKEETAIKPGTQTSLESKSETQSYSCILTVTDSSEELCASNPIGEIITSIKFAKTGGYRPTTPSLCMIAGDRISALAIESQMVNTEISYACQEGTQICSNGFMSVKLDSIVANSFSIFKIQVYCSEK